MGNKNSSSKSKVHGYATKVTSTEPQHVPRYEKSSTKTNMMVGFSEEQGISNASEQQYYKMPLDDDDIFTDYIRRAKYKIRTVTVSKSNVDSKHGNAAPAPAPAPAPDEAYGTNNNIDENQNDQFSEFIQLAKKRLRSTSSIGNNGSLKRG